MDQLKHGAWVQLEGCAECKYRLPPLCCLLDRGDVLLSLTAEGAPGQQLRIGPSARIPHCSPAVTTSKWYYEKYLADHGHVRTRNGRSGRDRERLQA